MTKTISQMTNRKDIWHYQYYYLTYNSFEIYVNTASKFACIINIYNLIIHHPVLYFHVLSVTLYFILSFNTFNNWFVLMIICYQTECWFFSLWKIWNIASNYKNMTAKLYIITYFIHFVTLMGMNKVPLNQLYHISSL